MMGNDHPQSRIGNRWAIFAWIASLSLTLAACCGIPAQETYAIGVVSYSAPLNPVLDGFKAGMAELGYVEGENITYLYSGVIETEAIDREIESLLAQDVDLLFVMGTLPALRARQAVEGTDVPVIFSPVINPVEEGIVDSTRHPGGNVTGVQTADTIPKALVWLLEIVPETKNVYVPYHPDDEVSATSLVSVREATSKLGIELLADEVRTTEELVDAVESLPEDTAIFLVPIPSIDTCIVDMAKVANERGIAIGTYQINYYEKGATIGYAPDLFSMGKQATQLADQILKGANPGDLPVETAEDFLTINLPAAEAAGIDIPDEILRQADTIIR